MARKLSWLLLVSGLLNVLLIGVLIGNLMARRWHHPPPRPHDHTAVEGLSPAAERLVESTMKRVHNENRKLRGDFERTQRQIAEALAAPRFDRALYLSRVQQLHELHGQRVMNMAEAVATVAPQLSPEERAALARQMEPPPGPPPPPRR